MTNESWFIRDTTLAIDVSLGDSSENEINLNLVLRSLHGIIDAQFHKLFFFSKYVMPFTSFYAHTSGGSRPSWHGPGEIRGRVPTWGTKCLGRYKKRPAKFRYVSAAGANRARQALPAIQSGCHLERSPH